MKAKEDLSLTVGSPSVHIFRICKMEIIEPDRNSL